MTDLSTIRPSAAPRWQRIATQTSFEAKAIVRNGEQLLITIILPALFMVALTLTDVISVTVDDGERVDVIVPGILALAVMSTAFTSQAIATGFDRRNGVLRLLATTPLGRSGMLVAKILAIFTIQLGQLLVLALIGVSLGWRPDASGLPAALVVIVLATAAFTGLAMLLAGTLRAEAVLAVANLLWVLLLIAGGVVLPAADLPAPLHHIVQFLPSGALGEGLRTAFSDGSLAPLSVVVLLGWAAALGWGTSRLFRWQ